MTVQEAKEILGSGNIITANCRSISITNKARDIAIECMEQVEQYRALGTVEELKEAREKQVAKKPIEKEFHKMLHWNCPICEGGLFHEQQYCDECGTKIDWSEEE